MALAISIIITGISIGLLVIYAADAAVSGGESGKGFLPLDAMTRGIGFGVPPIILPIMAFFISRKEPSKGLGTMIIIAGILIIIGGVVFFSIISSGDTENVAKSAGMGGGLIAIGGVIAALGSIKIKRS
ncbi:MAG: hypothetical protein IH841_05330 [Thaumarchaeota archaeon]|nr:hypothetical protein [Nitrososphaerota archaeon]